MHKLAKGLKKKKKQKKGKKGAEDDEFNPEELERYRRERAEAQLRAAESGDPGASESGGEPAAAADSDEWRKFQALTAGVDSILKKSQGDLDRIKSTSFFQRKLPDPKPTTESNEPKKSKRWIGFDESGNPVGEKSPEEEEEKAKLGEASNGFVEVPDDEDGQEDSAEEDIFDTTYVDVLQNIDVQLAYIPDSPTEEELGDDPFDTTTADKVLKTVDKRGNKLVSLGNAVEVLSGRIDHVSTCKISRPRKARNQDLLLGDFDESEPIEPPSGVVAEPVEVTKTLLDDDTDLPDIPVDLTKLPPVLPKPAAPEENRTVIETDAVDVSEFEVLRERTILEEIPDLDDAEFDLDANANDVPLKLEEADDPFSAKEPEINDFQTEIIEASFETATFVDEEDPFDTTFAENLVPGKTELKFIEKELEDLPISEVAISLTDPAGLSRDYETGLITSSKDQDDDTASSGLSAAKRDLLGGSVTDLDQLADQPIAPVEEITYVDPFDTSAVQELPPGKIELKFLEQEFLGETKKDDLSDDDFDPRGGEDIVVKSAPPRPQPPPALPSKQEPVISFVAAFDDAEESVAPGPSRRKPSRPEELGLAAPVKSVAFDLPTPSQRPDLLKTTEEEKSIRSKPLTPYTQRSFEEEVGPQEEVEDVDPFDTSFVAKVAPGKKELKLIESELLKSQLSHSLSDHDFNPRSEATQSRRFSDFSSTTIRPKSLKIVGVADSFTEEFDSQTTTDLRSNSEAGHGRSSQNRQDSLLDEDFEVNAKPLTPKIESKIPEEELSYADPFDTSIAVNILPGQAELKLLESELSQIPPQATSTLLYNDQDFDPRLPDDTDFDPRADEPGKLTDFLDSAGQDNGVKILTPYQQADLHEEDIDPFDTSFATIDPGKVELKLLESEFMAK